jgi:flagellar motor switch protein FliM
MADEKGGESDAIAAEWSAMIEAAATANVPDAGVDRLLNQDEIDNLLGFSTDESSESSRSGLRAIVDSAMVSYERLPMLEIVFDRLVRLLTTSLRNFFSDNVEVSLSDINSVRFGDYINSIPLPTILSVFRAEEWDNFGLLTVDSTLAYSVIDVLLGGRRGTAAMRIEGRPYTTIERTLVELGAQEPLHTAPRQYITRLSDLLFVLARVLNRAAGGTDVLWQQRKTMLLKQPEIMDLPFPKRSANDLSGCLVDHHLGFQTMLLFLTAVVSALVFLGRSTGLSVTSTTSTSQRSAF